MTVLQRQSLLKYLGGEYDPGAVDGLDGPKTQAAMDRIKRDYGVGEDGLVGIIAGTVAKKASDKTSDKEPGGWWAEIRHFRPEEENITCPCYRCRGKKIYPEERLMREADHIRDVAKKPMVPSSVRRCQARNDELPGSAPNSYHVTGLAMDFDIPALADSQIKAILDEEKAAGRVRYWYQMSSGWFHFDVN